jgi:hypothetical protein
MEDEIKIEEFYPHLDFDLIFQVRQANIDLDGEALRGLAERINSANSFTLFSCMMDVLFSGKSRLDWFDNLPKSLFRKHDILLAGGRSVVSREEYLEFHHYMNLVFHGIMESFGSVPKDSVGNPLEPRNHVHMALFPELFEEWQRSQGI